MAKTTALRIQGNGLPTFAQLGVNTYQYTNSDGQNFFNGATGGWSGNGFPGTFYTTTPSLSEDIDWTKGAHALSFGGVWTRPFFDGDGPFQANGLMTFSGLITSGANAQSPGADGGLHARAASRLQPGRQPDRVRERDTTSALYAQDVWRANSHVTLNYGLRWEPFLAAKDQNGFNMAFVRGNFDQGIHSSVYKNAPAGLVFPGDAGFPTNGANTTNNFKQFAPRAGIIWDPKGDGVQTIRVAAGKFYDSPKLWQYGHHMLNRSVREHRDRAATDIVRAAQCERLSDQPVEPVGEHARRRSARRRSTIHSSFRRCNCRQPRRSSRSTAATSACRSKLTSCASSNGMRRISGSCPATCSSM